LRNFFIGDDTYEAFAQERSQSIAQQHASDRQQFASQLAQTHSEQAATNALLQSTERALRDVCAERDAAKEKLTRSQDTLAERDQALAELDQAITERDQTVGELKQAITEREHTIEAVKQECGALSAETVSLHARIERLQIEGERYARLLTEVRARADDVERQMDTMLRSKTWRFTSAIRRFLGRTRLR
jgi:chromosome segregation ATPase